MSRPILNPNSAAVLAALKAKLPHAVLITGSVGAGLTTVACDIAGKSLEAIIEPTDREGIVNLSSNGVIRTKQVRELSQHAATKTTKRRVYIIDQAQQMNTTSQNAFLKLLEEPVPGTHFILTSHAVQQLLPTVRSRIQTFTLEPITIDQSELLLTRLKVYDETTRQQMLFLASGRPSELTRLATTPSYFEQRSEYTRDARAILRGTIVERLAIIERYQATRAQALHLLDAALRIIEHSLRQSATYELLLKAESVTIAYDRIVANGNIRLQLTRLLF